jgi:hypothetical protein
VTRRTLTIITLTAAVAGMVGGMAGFAWHAPGKPATWNDIRSWATFAVVVLGFTIAAVELNLQRLQLRDQHVVMQSEAWRNERRDELLDGQLAELQQRAALAERAQADMIQVSMQAADPVGQTEEGKAAGAVSMAIIANASGRPIRKVVARFQRTWLDKFGSRAEFVAELIDIALESGIEISKPTAMKPVDKARLLRPGQRIGMISGIPVESFGLVGAKVRFTDDAGAHWEIDPDLHLAKLSSRDW